MRLDRNYDALGRITWSAESENGYVLTDTEYDWFYGHRPRRAVPNHDSHAWPAHAYEILDR
jgi:hypothetical protein